MSEAALDEVVKGTPNPDLPKSKVVSDDDSRPSTAGKTSVDNTSRSATPQASDPTSLLPSSPPQIYLNLLIIEASLRSQYLALRARRRQNTCVLFWLAVWIAYFFYTQFLRLREDGSGVGGSPYWLKDMGERIALMSGCITGVLFWVTGQWERGIKWPRRWFVTANRGLRGMNCKIVHLRPPWWKEVVSQLISLILPLSWFYPTPGSSYQFIDYSSSEKRQMIHHTRLRPGTLHEYIEEDIASGGDHIQIMLMAKHFTAEFRENWEMYRSDFWEQENSRRADLRKRVRRRQREIARQEGGWLWWTGWRGWAKTLGFSRPKPFGHDVEKIGLQQHHVHSALHNQGLKRHSRRSSLMMEKERALGHSRNSSRSSTLTPEPEELERRGSIGSARRRKAAAVEPGQRGSISNRNSMRLTSTDASSSSRPATPATPASAMTLRSQASSLSNVSFSSDDGSEPPQTPVKTEDEIPIKAEPAD